jgi:hypothetical protein
MEDASRSATLYRVVSICLVLAPAGPSWAVVLATASKELHSTDCRRFDNLRNTVLLLSLPRAEVRLDFVAAFAGEIPDIRAAAPPLQWP